MPTQPHRVMHGNRSHRSSAEPLVRRVVVALSLVLTLLLVPTPADAAYVFLDPGHGGPYSGAVYGGVTEARVNLLLGFDIRTALVARGHRVSMSRTGDRGVGGPRPAWHWDDDGVFLRDCDGACAHDAPIADLQARVDMANASGADLFISIHNNAASSSSARGTETYHNWDNETDRVLSQQLARYLQQGIVSQAGTRDRGTYGVGFYVVRWANMPAVLLEVGFLSNAGDRALLLSPSFRRKVAAGVATGVDRFLATDPFAPVYPRVEGPDRYATAAAVATEGSPDGAETVLLASGEAWPDSLAATPLAVETTSPVLLTRPERLPAATAQALAALAPSRIRVLGGETAIAPAVAEAAADAAGIPMASVERLAGPDRYSTASRIADALESSEATAAFLVSGGDFPDALSASAWAGSIGAPVLMTRRAELPDVTREHLSRHAETLETLYVLGGPAAVGEDVAARASAVASATLVRVWGPTRYETNLSAIRSYWTTGTLEPLVAKATDFPDALVAGAVAARRSQPIMLVGTSYLPARTRELLMNEEERFGGFVMIGGPQAVSHVLEWELVKAMRRDE